MHADVFKAGQSYLILKSNNLFLAFVNLDNIPKKKYIVAVKNTQNELCLFAAGTLNN